MAAFHCRLCGVAHELLHMESGHPVVVCPTETPGVQHIIDTRYLLINGWRLIADYDGLVTIVHPDDYASVNNDH